MNKLRKEDLQVLREVVLRNRPDLAGVVSLIGEVALTVSQREDLRGVLADELCATGLKPDSEPNERGLWLDDILGKLMFY